MKSLSLLLVAAFTLQARGQAATTPVATTAASLPPLIPIKVGTPLYPDTIQRARLHGIAAVAALLSPGGITKQISVIRRVHPILDSSCVEAVGHMRFNTIPLDSDRAVVFTFSFELTGGTGPEGTYAVSEEFPFSWRVVGWLPPVEPRS